jgi:trehalose-6-phosphate synthase
VAFQTHGHLQQFRSALLRVLGIESRVIEVAVDARQVRLEALPIGIAPEAYTSLLGEDGAAAPYYTEMVARYNGRRVLLAVDRLDYTKGILERLRAYAQLLRSSSELREKVVLIQIAVPTREGIDAYQDQISVALRLRGQ